MDKWSNAAISGLPEPDRCRRSLLPACIFILIFALVCVGSPRPAPAALSCGAEPEGFSVDAAAKIKRDTEDKTNLILHAAAKVDQRALVTAKRRELRHSHAEADASLLDRYLLWVTCQSISNDPALAPAQKFEDYSKFYRLMSEPIDKAAHPAE